MILMLYAIQTDILALYTCMFYLAILSLNNSEYTIHHTKLRESDSGFLECNVKAKGQIKTNITDLGTENLKILFSPGFYQKEKYA